MQQHAARVGEGRASLAMGQPWARTAEDVLADLGVSTARGLGVPEVSARRRRYGPNRLREARRVPAWRILLDQFRSLVVALLGAAALVSFAVGDWIEGYAIAVVVVLNASIGFLTELRAVRSMEALRRLGHVRVRVRRDGTDREIPAEALVPGDIVPVEAGDVVTADLRLVEASKLEANESTLTGESTPVGKTTAPLAPDTPLAERANLLFKGTSVTRGSGLGAVVATGMATELGRIAELAEEAEQAATPLEVRLEKLGRRLVGITLGIAAVTAAAGMLRGKDAILMIETAIALAVAAVPEGLPIVATLALARGMWRMARHNVLINRLSAVETLGATGVIFSDKTGTLTENRMTVTRLALPEGDVVLDGGLDPGDAALRRALEVGALCNNATLGPDGEGIGDPLEVALLVAAGKAGVRREDLLGRMPERREEAFDPERRMMATFHETDAGFRVAVKGATESVLACSDADAEARDRWLERSRDLAASGLRVLALAEKAARSLDGDPYRGLTVLGLAGMHDPPRDEVAAALEAARRAGVRVIMVTGDQADTARSIGRTLRLVDENAQVVLGRDLPPPGRLDEEARSRLLRAPLFARVEPKQKLDLIELHQQAGHVVAMTGDGVNDAPALRKADIGVAMGRRGTQVAREAADMILRDDAFGSIVRAIRQGRIIFTNIRRFVLFLMSCNLSEIAVVFGASALNVPLPLLPLHILYLNLVTDVFPALALGFGEGDEDVMKRPPRDPKEPILARSHWAAIAFYGVLITACVLTALLVGLYALGFQEERAVTVSFLTLAFAQVWHVFNMRDRGSHPLRNDVVRNPWIWGAVALCAVLLVAAVHLPVLSGVLRTVDPGAAGWTLAMGLSLVPLVAGQLWRQTASPAKAAGPVLPAR